MNRDVGVHYLSHAYDPLMREPSADQSTRRSTVLGRLTNTNHQSEDHLNQDG